MADDDKKPEADDDTKQENDNDILIGGGGDDKIYGGGGGDVITGGSGQDTIYGGEGGDWIRGGSGHDLIYGGSGDDVVMGDAGNDTIVAGMGDDLIIDSAGDDTMVGGQGADTFAFTPGHGDDTIVDFDTANDKIDLTRLTADITFEQLQGKMSTVTDPDDPDTVTGVQIDLTEFGGGTITLRGIADIADLTAEMFILPGGASPLDDILAETPIEGTDDDQFFIGGTGGETYRTQGGDDIVLGEEGDDTIYGGDGHDAIHGGEGDDTIYGGDGHDSIQGGEGDDVIEGGDGHDLLIGGAGQDMLIGGEGDDTLIGGEGADTFAFRPDHGNDTIADFSDGEDLIDLSAFTGITGFGDLSVVQQGENVQIDLSAHDGGTITLSGFNLGDLDASDFAFHVEAPMDGM